MLANSVPVMLFTQLQLQGPVNTWSRTAYVQPTIPSGETSDTPLIQEWTNIDNNFVRA